MSVKNQPNIIFLVWDACRADYVAKAAYEDDWRVIESDGTELGFHDGQGVDLDELLSELIKTACDAHSELSDLIGIKTTSETEPRLRELGYL